MMTNEELRADLLADPTTVEFAEENGMTLAEYVEATIAYCDNPDAGFAGEGQGAPDCEHDEEAILEAKEKNEYVAGRPTPPIPNVAPGEGITSEKPAYRPKSGTFRV